MKPRSTNSDFNVILYAATKLAEKIGRDNISFTVLAKELNISRTILYTHFYTKETLKHEVLCHALATDNLIILIEAIIFKHISPFDILESTRQKIVNLFK